jgi:hypothetical protein
VEENDKGMQNSQSILTILADAYNLNFVEGADFRNNIIKENSQWENESSIFEENININMNSFRRSEFISRLN